jgi:hypothetical protein
VSTGSAAVLRGFPQENRILCLFPDYAISDFALEVSKDVSSGKEGISRKLIPSPFLSVFAQPQDFLPLSGVASSHTS